MLVGRYWNRGSWVGEPRAQLAIAEMFSAKVRDQLRTTPPECFGSLKHLLGGIDDTEGLWHDLGSLHQVFRAADMRSLVEKAMDTNQLTEGKKTTTVPACRASSETRT
jgi:hypothetical protein